MSSQEGIELNNGGATLEAVVTRIDRTSFHFADTLELVRGILEDKDNYVIADKKVLQLHGDIEKMVSNERLYSFSATEKEKSWKRLSDIVDHTIKSGTSRKGALVAVGGGVVTDMVGLAANLYFRGVRVILIPTTLLAMVDAAVGGKVAVNHPHQKNMLGSFYHPSEVYMVTDMLKTLDARQMYSAAGETLKLAILSDTDLFSLLEGNDNTWVTNKEVLLKIIKMSVSEKMRMLGENCFERDLERPLNLGHSVAHPLEDITDFKVYHGEAVSYGLLIAANISLQRNMISTKDYNRIFKTAVDFGCTTNVTGFDKEELWKRIRRLVLQRGGTGLLYVLPTGVGSSAITNDISKEELNKAISALEDSPGNTISVA